MPDPTCPLCQGPLAPGVIVVDRAGVPVLYSNDTEFFSLTGRKYHSALQHKVCVDCGFVLSFAVTPELFRDALGGEKGTSAGFPIPHAPEEAPPVADR
jgi:hypothetical protein